MIYAALLLLLLLSAACAGNAIVSPTPAAPPPAGLAPTGIALTPPPPTLTPVIPPTPTPTLTPPTRPPTNNPATLPPTPIPGPALTPTLPPITTHQRIPYVQLTAGKHHACALRADGVAHCWGDARFGKTYVPARMRFRQISAGLHFTCGLRYAGDLTCWGDNSQGQTAAPSGQFTQIAAGRAHACALDQDGKAVCWGDVASPETDAAFTALGSGFRRSCGLTIAGGLECWNAAGETSSRAGPFAALSVGLHHNCALRPDGTAVCFGSNSDDQAAPPPTAFAAIAAGWHHSCGITQADGVLECWGVGHPGQSGQRLGAPAGVFTSLSSGWRNNCALRPNGAAQCWQQRTPPPSPTTQCPAPAFNFPVELFPWPAGGLAVVERAGVIRAYDYVSGAGPCAAPRPILDLTDQVEIFGDRGMVSAALDPDFDQFPFLYVYYHHNAGPTGRSEGRLSRFPVVDGVAVRAAELVLLKLPDLVLVHVSGAIRFGPDGMLYLGIGDNDHEDHAQNLASRHGKIIRINVRDATAAQPYRIPSDNPFAATPGALPEIWAYGLRHPYRMDFDAAGNLWVADVGHLKMEEVSIATAGANLGWPLFEGTLCRRPAADCAALRATATAPVATYTRNEGRAIIGGIASPRPGIAYLFGDFLSGRIWALERDFGDLIGRRLGALEGDAAAAAGWRMRELAPTEGAILGFGTGAAGEVYVLTTKHIRRLEW